MFTCRGGPDPRSGGALRYDMRDRLTQRQNQVLEFIRRRIHRDGRAPSLQEIAQGIGVSSVSGVHKMLVVLEEKGHIRRRPHEARSIELLDEEEPFHAAGELPGVLMLKTMEQGGRRVRRLTSEGAAHPLPRSMSRAPVLVDPSLVPDDVDLGACLGVVAEDDGMSGAGVWKGDLVVVEEMDWERVPDGALAAVLFYDRVVIRKLEVLDGRLFFRAADKTYADESARSDDPDFFVIGRALAMMRRLGR